MKKLKKVKILGKSIPVLVLVLLGVGLASAALLPYFGRIITTVEVEQSILLDGQDYTATITDGPFHPAPGGETFCFAHDLENKMSIAGTVELVTTHVPAGGITTSYYELETLVDTRNQEKVWGGTPDVVPLTGQLEVSIKYEGENVVFKAITPTDYNAETTLTTFTFDTDSDGIADFQIQYMGSDVWNYSGVDVASLTWDYSLTGWESVPSEFVTDNDINNREFTLKVPMSVLGGLGSNYMFGVQANGVSGHQTFYSTDPAHLWYQTNDYVHSTYYVPMDLGTALTTPVTLASGETKDFGLCHAFNVLIMPGNYTITTKVVPAP